MTCVVSTRSCKEPTKLMRVNTAGDLTEAFG